MLRLRFSFNTNVLQYFLSVAEVVVFFIIFTTSGAIKLLYIGKVLLPNFLIKLQIGTWFPNISQNMFRGGRFRRRFNSIPFVVGILITTKYLLILAAWILEIMHSSIPPVIVRCFDTACATLIIINILNLIGAIYGGALYNRGVIVDVVIQVLVILISCGKCAFLMLNLL